MQFVIIAFDGTDDDAFARREQFRKAHLNLGAQMVQSGQGVFGGAMLDDAGNMIGSIKIVDFPSRKELDEYLSTDPYVAGKVWQNIQVLPFQTSPAYK